MLNSRAFSRQISTGFVAIILGLVAVSAHAQDRYVISTDGQEVTDNSSHLTWRRCAEGTSWLGSACVGKPTKLSLADAKAWAASQSAASGKSWRLPSESELTTLVDKTKKKPKIDAVAFPGTPPTTFWCTRPGVDDNLNAYLVNFANGKVTASLGEAKVALRLVRAN